MNEAVEEQFKKHCERSETLVSNRRKRLPDQGKGLFYTFELYNLLNTAFDSSSIAKHHMIGLIAFLEGIAAPIEQGGVIQKIHLEQMETLAERLARWVRPEIPNRTALLFSKAVATLLIFCAGLSVYSARAMKKGPKRFRDEMLLRFLLGTGLLRELFMSVIAGLDGDEKRGQLTADLLESLSYGICLISLQGENVDEAVIHGIRPLLLRTLPGAKEAVLSIQAPQAAGFIETIALALDKQDYDRWISSVRELLAFYGSELQFLLDDLAEIGKITETVLEAYQASKENRPNLVHMVG